MSDSTKPELAGLAQMRETMMARLEEGETIPNASTRSNAMASSRTREACVPCTSARAQNGTKRSNAISPLWAEGVNAIVSRTPAAILRSPRTKIAAEAGGC